MRKLIAAAILCVLAGPIWGQGSRFDSNVFTSANSVPFGTQATMYVVPNAVVKVCAYPAAGNPCTNVVNVYSDPGLTQPITQPLQADVHGRFGFWAAPGEYSYNVTSALGTNFGNFTITLAGTGGGSATFPSTPGIVYSLNASTARNATVADVTGLFTGCSGTLFLRFDGTCGGAGLSLTTTGTSGLATLSGTTLNVPNYTVTVPIITALGTLTNDISGSAAKIGGVAVSGVPGTGQVPMALSSTTASWQNPFALTTTGSGAATYSGGTLNIPTSSLTLTTTGSSGLATYSGGTLNVPNYSQVYPGAGIPNSTGSAWGTSYSTSGTGTTVPLTDSPTFTGTANFASLAASGVIRLNTDTGLSRDSAGVLDIGNGTAGSTTGTVQASLYNLYGGGSISSGISALGGGEIAVGNATPGDFSGAIITSEYKIGGTFTPTLGSCGSATITGSTNAFHIASITTGACTATFDSTRQPSGYCTANAWTGTTAIPVVPQATSASVVLTFTGTPTDATVICF